MRYNINGTYFGAHIGGGYQFALNADNQLDLSAKYLWSGIGSKDILVTGDPIHFDSLNSHRLRLKGENSYQINSDYSLLTGLGYEYEFDGKAQGTTYSQFAIDAPSVKGSTGLAMIGVRYEPTSNKDLSIDFKANGYFGKRDGGSALLHLQYKF